MALTKCRECGEEISKKAEKCPKCGSPQKKKTSLFTWLVVIVLGLWFIGYISNGSKTTISEKTDNRAHFRQVGYLKDNAKNRIFTIAYKHGTSEQEIRTHAKSLMHTSGQMMAAYFYPEGSTIPADGVTLAGSMFKANDVLYDMPGLSKWRYAYMRHFKGSSEFVDCEQNQSNDLCRKK